MPHALAVGMASISSFRQLHAWQVSMELTDSVIATTRLLPRVEFDLRRQMNRAAISMPSNIAEGSHAELETQLEICFRNRFLDPSTSAETIDLLNRAGRLLERLHDSLH